LSFHLGLQSLPFFEELGLFFHIDIHSGIDARLLPYRLLYLFLEFSF
jgi:hypothetical protein